MRTPCAKKAARDGGEEIPKKELAIAADQLKAYAGGYWCDELGVFYRLSLIEGKIRLCQL
jgi:hypothetical protein